MVGNEVDTCPECARKSKFISLDFAIGPKEVQLYLAPDRGVDDDGNIMDSRMKVGNDSLNVSHIPMAEGQSWRGRGFMHYGGTSLDDLLRKGGYSFKDVADTDTDTETDTDTDTNDFEEDTANLPKRKTLMDT